MWNPSTERIGVLVRLAEPLLQVGVSATLADDPLLHVLGGTESQDGNADVVVTDWVSCAVAARPGTRILVISSQAREHAVLMALRAGVHGVVLSRCSTAELIDAVRTLARGASYVCREVAQCLAVSGPRDDLTAREGEVLRLLALGQCNKTIARHLGIAVGTVKTHVKGVLAKLDASSRTEAASIAAERGIVDIPEFHPRRPWAPALERLAVA